MLGPAARSVRPSSAVGSDATLTLEEAWDACRDLYEPLAAARPSTFDSLEDELLFCLLGGFGISYELNRSAAVVVARLVPFDAAHDREELRDRIARALGTAQFEPRTAGGGLRRYRFPKRKAELVVAARTWLLGRPGALGDLLRNIGCERSRRSLLCECPGIGPKTASWLLRNLGLAHELAILDVHLVRALEHAGRIEAKLTLPRDYEIAEQAFLDWCRELDAPPAAFDLFVWEWQRGNLTSALAG